LILLWNAAYGAPLTVDLTDDYRDLIQRWAECMGKG